MNLKQYPSDTLSVLRRFYLWAGTGAPPLRFYFRIFLRKRACESIAHEPDQTVRLGTCDCRIYDHAPTLSRFFSLNPQSLFGNHEESP